MFFLKSTIIRTIFPTQAAASVFSRSHHWRSCKFALCDLCI